MPTDDDLIARVKQEFDAQTYNGSSSVLRRLIEIAREWHNTRVEPTSAARERLVYVRVRELYDFCDARRADM